MQQRRRRRLRGSPIPPGGCVEYVAPSGSQQRHGDQPGGALTRAVSVTLLAYARPLGAGRRVRITLWEEPLDEHVVCAQTAATLHGYTLTKSPDEKSAYILERSIANEGEVTHLRAS